MISRETLIGCWELIEHGIYSATGKFKRTSDYLSGRLLYESSGYMSVLITLRNPVQQTSDLIAYAGKFSVKENYVFHHVEVASRSERVGQTEERLAELSGQNLILRTVKTPKGFYEITWKRL